MEEQLKQRALASSLSRMGSGLLKTVSVSVRWLTNDELGYTSIGSKHSCTVNVSWYNKMHLEQVYLHTNFFISF